MISQTLFFAGVDEIMWMDRKSASTLGKHYHGKKEANQLSQ